MNNVALGVVGWLAGAAIWFWWVRRYDRLEQEPMRALLAVGLVGGLASGLLAGVANDLMAMALGFGDGVAGVLGEDRLTATDAAVLATFVGFNEEILKATAAVLVTSWFGDLDEPVDAPLYGMMTALGFGVIENLHYAHQFGELVLLPRYLLATPVHVVLALLWGNAWARGRFLLPRQPLWLVMAPALGLAGALHAAWDYVQFTRSTPGGIVALIGLVTLAVWAHGTKLAIAMESPFLKTGQCPRCGDVGQRRARFCRRCGQALYGRYYAQCCGCEARIPSYSAFCPRCGVAQV